MIEFSGVKRMRVLENLEPKRVFYYFEELCKIPHGSRNTKQISDYCVEFAKDQGLMWYQDNDNNVIIIKDAAPGYEKAEPIIIQGHLDMVCEKTADCTIDMEKEGLSIYVDGDEIRAHKTTLGGDDGIAVAMALAILENKTLLHPRLEAVFTVDEEIGMLGAVSIDVSMLKGHTMLNLDSEDEGVFTVSCAGGNVAECVLPLTKEAYSGKAYEITITGLKGGHSGVEINKGRANANVLMGRFLQEIADKAKISLLRVDGGLKDNAIPVSSTAWVTGQEDILKKEAVSFRETLRREYASTDPDIAISVEEKEAQNVGLCDRETTKKVICLLCCLPNGIQKMSMDIEGLVQTSLNMGIVKTTEKELSISFCVRSSVASEKEMINRRLFSMMEQLGGTCHITGDYPAWEYRKDSKLRELMIEIFKEQYQREPKVEAIHAGVECGMFAGKIKDLDCVSFGPDLKQIHTVRESMSISSVQRVYAFVLEILKRCKE